MAKEIRSVSDIVPDLANANKGTERGRYAVEASLRETGAGRSIVVDREGRIIAGNKTLESWADISGDIEIVKTDGTKLVVVQREDLDLEDVEGLARKLAYYDNRSSELGLAWDPAQLFSDLNAGVDLSGMFYDDEIEAILATVDGFEKNEPLADPGAQVSKADELQEKWQVKLGDLWQLGEHRLICGDCTDPAVVERVMGGEKAVLGVHDPPYGVEMDKGFAGKAAFSGKGKPIPRRQYSDNWDSAPPSDFSLILQSAKQVILWGGNNFADKLPASSHWLVWDKNNTMPTYGDCELAWTNIDRKSIKKYEFEYNGLIGKEKERFHPTQKPVGLYVSVVADYSQEGEIISDFYAGSGTTLIACEQLGRKCLAIELHPPYVAVALQRWADMTNREPVRIA